MKQTACILLLLSLILTACSGGARADNFESEQTIAITHVNLVPMTAEIVLENQTVLIEGSRIAAIGAADEIKL